MIQFYLYVSVSLIFIIVSYYKSKSFLTVIIAVIVLNPYLYTQFEVKGSYYFIHILILVLFSQTIINNSIHKQIKVGLLAIFIIIIISFVLNFNTTNAANVALWILQYSSGFLLTIAVIVDKKHTYHLKDYFKIVLPLFLVQIFLIFTTKFGVNPLPNDRLNYHMVDYAIGTFGNPEPESDFLAISLLIIIPFMFLTFKSKRLYKLTTILLLMTFLETNTLHTIPLLIMAIVIQIFLIFKVTFINNKIKILSLSLFSGLTIILMINSLQVLQNNPYMDIVYGKSSFNIIINNYINRIVELPKLVYLENAYNVLINTDFLRILFGFGSGTFGSQFALQHQGYFSLKMYDLNQVNFGGISVTSNPSSGFLGIFSELGLLGLAFIIILFFKVLIHFKKGMKNIDEDKKVAAVVGLGISLYFILLFFIRDFFGGYQFYFACIIIGICYREVQKVYSK